MFQTFGHDVNYGTEVKVYGPHVGLKTSNKRVPRRYNPQVCKSVIRQAQIGNPDQDQINTSRIERLNLTLRMFNRRFTRSTLGYSKNLDNHKFSVALFIAFYNFCRKHSSLNKETPAQAAGLTDHVWTVKELLSTSLFS